MRDAVAGRIPLLNPRSQKAITAFVELIDGLRELVDEGTDVADVLEAVLDRTGYRAELEGSDDPQDASRLENLDELVTVAREFTEFARSVGEDTGTSEDTDVATDFEDADVAEPGSLSRFWNGCRWWPTPIRSRPPTAREPTRPTRTVWSP